MLEPGAIDSIAPSASEIACPRCCAANVVPGVGRTSSAPCVIVLCAVIDVMIGRPD